MAAGAGGKIYSQQNVFDAALARVRWVYDTFPVVYVHSSGGKDSTVVLQLALRVAEEKGRLPVPVLFLDQEAEWQAVVDYTRTVMSDPRVSPRWLQFPFRLFNATSYAAPWLHCWDPACRDIWIHPQQPDAITRNIYGTDRFRELFTAYLRVHHPRTPVAALTGMRCEESPMRAIAFTAHEVYQGVSWGNAHDKERKHFKFAPLYDWMTSDVWKAIHDGGGTGTSWPYCHLYDLQWMHGMPISHMRVSNLHHETAVRNLFYVQELEPATWDRVTRRLAGTATAGQLQEDFYGPPTLPPMFVDWAEYRDYLLEHLVTDPAIRATFRGQFDRLEPKYADPRIKEDLHKVEVAAILVNDYEFTKIHAWETVHLPDSRLTTLARRAATAPTEGARLAAARNLAMAHRRRGSTPA